MMLASRFTLFGVVLLTITACNSPEQSTTKPSVSSQPPVFVAARPIETPHTPSLVASSQCQALDLRLDGGFVYWRCDNLETEMGSVLRVPLTGGEVETVVEKQKNLTSFTTGEGVVFWSTEDGLLSKPFVGGLPKRLAKRNGGARGLYVYSGSVYWSEFGDLYRLPRAGGAPSRLHERTPGPGGIANALTGDRDEIFWSLDDAVLTQRSDGSGFRELAKGFRQVRALAVEGTNVYVADAGDGKTGAVFRIDRSTGSKYVLLDRAPRPWWVAATGTDVFVVDNGARGGVARIGPDGVVYSFASNLRYGTSVVATDGAVFWTTAEPGAVWKAPR